MIENEKLIRSDIFKYEDRRFYIYICFFLPESERDAEDQIKRTDKKNKMIIDDDSKNELYREDKISRRI